jgi:hypothetical protein
LLSAASLSFGLAAIATAVDGWPLPRAFDEFSYLLSAETFASGRLANPPYPLPDAIETIHVLQEPTYGSKYLPGHGLVLALGQALGGGPRLGQWLAFAAMGAAILWMLRGWLAPRSAAVTAAVFMIVLADSDWAAGFWGSSEAVAGSALIFGVIGRLRGGPSFTHGALLGLGAVLLALTRPLEGLAACLAPAGYITWWILHSPERKRRLMLVAAPAVAVLTLGMTLLAAHNHAVTGNALRLAYAHYEAQAPGAPPFVWQASNEPKNALRANQRARLNIDFGSYRSMRSRWRSMMWSRTWDTTVRHYFPYAAFAVAFLLVPFTMRDRRLWLAVGSAVAVGGAVGISSYYLPHYLGPALPPLLLLYAMACGVLTRLKWPTPGAGRLVAAGLVVAIASLGLAQIFTHTRLERAAQHPTYWTRERNAIATQITTVPGKHVVFVRYAPSYRSQNEWVQNGADLKNTALLWVHDLGGRRNAELRLLEGDRSAWLLTVHGDRAAELTRYPSRTAVQATAAP